LHQQSRLDEYRSGWPAFLDHPNAQKKRAAPDPLRHSALTSDGLDPAAGHGPFLLQRIDANSVGALSLGFPNRAAPRLHQHIRLQAIGRKPVVIPGQSLSGPAMGPELTRVTGRRMGWCGKGLACSEADDHSRRKNAEGNTFRHLLSPLRLS
jgi:hypothetical protein